MNRISLLGAICAFIFSLSNSAIAAGLVIDNFNVGSPSVVTDNDIGGVVSGSSNIDGANIVMNGIAGWTRTLRANLSEGDTMSTVVCNDCQGGHVTMGGGSSNGIGSYFYSGSAVDLSSYSELGFDWGADLAGAGVDILFSDGVNTATVASWTSLAATGGSAPTDLVAQLVMGIEWGAVDSTAITEIEFVVSGVQNMDSVIDNINASGSGSVSAVPVPAAVWLFGSGLVGLIGISKKKKA
ncbi:MAG: hypothetical protein L3J59_04980 [Methylococcaceae bacterium]|nr:hypothetical protein [Methylococcaceae bacterium]